MQSDEKKISCVSHPRNFEYRLKILRRDLKENVTA